MSVFKKPKGCPKSPKTFLPVLSLFHSLLSLSLLLPPFPYLAPNPLLEKAGPAGIARGIKMNEM